MRRVERKFKIEGLDCPNCARKIEEKLSKNASFNKVILNFSTSELIVKSKDGSIDTESIKKIVKEIEPDVEIIDLNESTAKKSVEEHSNILSRDLVLILSSILIFSTGLIFKEKTLIIFAYALTGYDVIYRAIKNLLTKNLFEEHFLMTVATFGAVAIGEYPEAYVVMAFYKIGEYLQNLAVQRSRKSISKLLDFKPEYANLKVNGNTVKVSPEKVKVNDLIVVKPGERVPLDGKIVEGKSNIDLSVLTGESLPKEVQVGDTVLSGSLNLDGNIILEVTSTYNQSTVSKIIKLIEEASNKKARTEKFFTKFASIYTPIVVLSAIAIALIPPVLFKAPFSSWLYRALIFLVISCPCALTVSIPLTFFGGIGGASKKGFLVKGSNYLEQLSKVNVVAFDKTGTLTTGKLKVVKISSKIDKDEFLKYIAHAEYFSNHQIAQAVKNEYKGSFVESEIKDVKEISGMGISAVVFGKTVLVGNEKLMNKESIQYEKANEYGTVFYCAIDGNYTGYIVVSDSLKEDSRAAVENLKDIGVKVALLTGDSKDSALHFSKELGIDQVHYELLPQQKVEIVEKLSKEGKVAFVGDGINDAPVLMRADVGIAMGKFGSDIAIESADIVLTTDHPSAVPNAIKHSKKTMKIVWQNISFALGVKFLVLILGAIGFANMWEAVFADVGVTLLTVANSLRVLRK